jgi:hypothetical protein
MPETRDRCLACRARLAEDGVCPRCGCDFSLARQAMEQAGRRLEQALRALAVGGRELARNQLDASLAMYRQPLAEALKNFLDSDGYCVESRQGAVAPLLPAAFQTEGESDGVRQDECRNPDSAVLPMSKSKGPGSD